MSSVPDIPNPAMTRERWERLTPLVDAVLEQRIGERRAYIAEISGSDTILATDLLRFVNADEQSRLEISEDSVFAAAARERSTLLSDQLFDTSADLRSMLQQSLNESYLIEGEIRGGGMSRVFVANEAGLGRKVVIKVLSRELTDEINPERLTREVKLAASLQQANIVPVLSAGTAAGFPYYTMPLVEGSSLRERLLRDGALPVNEAISIMRDVARALAFAHGRGIVHRDIKPGNILLSDRTAVVTDFGIARAIGAAREGTPDAKMIEAGFGTPAYVAPEQASGKPDVDHRADIYSFGCVAYELLNGKPPFCGSLHEIIEAHLKNTPALLTELRPEVPDAVAQLVASCIEKDPARRPQSANDILISLESAAIRAVPVDRWTSRSVVLALATLVVVAAAVGRLSYVTMTTAEAQPLTFAAVPFLNATQDTSLDFRSDGIGDEILSGMAKVKGIQIVGRSAAFRYKRRTGADALDVPAIERALGTRLLLTGTLRETNGQVIISAQLNDSVSRSELWSDSFSRDRSNLGSMTDEIVRRLADTLRTRFGSRIGLPLRAVSTGSTTNPKALDLYLIGQSQLRRRGSGIGQSIGSFERAIKLDNNFAKAHAALAISLELEPFFNGTPPASVMGRAIAEAKRALELDSTLADAHAALGGAYPSVGQWEKSDQELRRAIELEPDNVNTRQTLARLLIIRGYADEAITQLQRARTVEPTSAVISAWLSYAFFLKGRRDLAVAEAERSSQLDPTGLPTANLGALVNVALGRNAAARRFVGLAAAPGMTNAAYVYAKLGDTASANRVLRTMEHRIPKPWFIDVSRASVFLATRDSAAALSALERSARETGPMWVFFIPLADPAFDLVRGSPRFDALLRRANLDPRTFRNPRHAG